MDKETAKKLILKEFVEDNTMRFACGASAFGFDEILNQSIIQYQDFFRSIITTIDLGNIRIFEYIFNKNKFTYKSEITISQEDLNCCYNAVHDNKLDIDTDLKEETEKLYEQYYSEFIL